MSTIDMTANVWQYATTVAAIALVAYCIQRWRNPIHALPSIGHSAPLLSYLSAFRFMWDAERMIQEGHEKYQGAAFKIAQLDGWLVVFPSPQLIDELRRIDDSRLSALEGGNYMLQFKHTLGPASDDPFQIAVVREKLTRSLHTICPDVFDELALAFEEHVSISDQDWVSVPMYPLAQEIIVRGSNRVFVGLPKCRDREYLKVAIDFTNELFVAAFFINMFPPSLKSIAARVLALGMKSKSRLTPMVVPMLQERYNMRERYGDDWTDKPNDILQWLLEEGLKYNKPFSAIVEKVLVLNFGSIHTTSMAFTQAMFNLAANPEYIQPLREEVDPLIASEGWTKNALGKMHKIDSFIRESLRLDAGTTATMPRLAMTDVTLSDGTRIPRGTLVVAATGTVQRDGGLYAAPDTFDPFRFARARAEGGAEGMLKHQVVHTSVNYIPFGHGKHACPGRFFAAMELKAMLAYVVLNYDVKLPDGAPRPKNFRFGMADMPSKDAPVLFRKRTAQQSA